jgi:hypothetical protein
MCQPPLTYCDGRCVDLTSDPAACGSCGKACAGSEACTGSRCACPSTPDYTTCGGVCTDTTTSPQHCGGCDRPCPAGQLCRGGACTPCSGDYFYCPVPGSDARETCLAHARDRADAGAGPDLACQCNQCLAELEDCAKDEACKITWQCAVRNACQAPCWGAMGVCPLGTPGGCFKWCPPGMPTAQTGARVEALLRCTIDKGCN